MFAEKQTIENLLRAAVLIQPGHSIGLQARSDRLTGLS
jgi:hypothetical protein